MEGRDGAEAVRDGGEPRAEVRLGDGRAVGALVEVEEHLADLVLGHLLLDQAVAEGREADVVRLARRGRDVAPGAAAGPRLAAAVDAVEPEVGLGGGLGLDGPADDLRRRADGCRAGRHGPQHDGAAADLRAVADLDVAQYRNARAEEHVAADLGVAVAALLARRAERHAVQYRAARADRRRLADDDARAVVEDDGLADGARRVDVDG